MILATHALAGAAIGKHIENPWIVIALSILLHFILDTFRHGEYLNQNSKMREFWKVAIDLLVGAAIILLVINFSNIPEMTARNMLLGSFFSMLPDLNTFLYWKLKFKFLRPIYEFHHRIHRDENLEEEIWNLRNATNDIIFSLIAIIFLLIK